MQKNGFEYGPSMPGGLKRLDPSLSLGSRQTRRRGSAFGLGSQSDLPRISARVENRGEKMDVQRATGGVSKKTGHTVPGVEKW